MRHLVLGVLGVLAVLAVLVACGGSNSGSGKVGGGPAAPAVRALAGDLVFVDVTVAPMDRDTTLAHQSVIVRGDKIVAIAPASQVEVPPGATRVDGTGKWLMPGLIDMHVHTWSERDLTMFVAGGVTTVRIMWGTEQHLAWRAAIARGDMLGPTLFTASPIIDGDPPAWPGSLVVTKPEEADALVADIKSRGYDFVKPYSRLDKPVYEALATAAKKHGLTLQGHIPSSVTLESALAAGQKSIEHLEGWFPALAPGVERQRGESVPALLRRLLPKIDRARIPVLAKAMVNARTANCPTLLVTARMAAMDDAAGIEKQVKWLGLVPPDLRARWDPKADRRLAKATPEDFATMRESNVVRDEIVRAIAAEGATLLVGTDAGNPYVIPGESMHDEIELLVAAKVPRPRVMRAATADAGTFIGQRGTLGVVAVGARADLLLVDVDPMASPIPLVPDGVVLHGRWLPKGDLEAKLGELAEPNRTGPDAR